MAQKIYKLVLMRSYTEAYYQLSAAEQEKLWAGVSEVVEAAGAKSVTPYYDCRWSNDKYRRFFILEYPSVEAAIQDIAGVEKLGLFRYMVSESILAIDAGPTPVGN